jgi:hypothetical protein
MPNPTVPATGGAMPAEPKFNRSAIMSKAWTIFRGWRADFADWQIARGLAPHVTFANALREAWRQAKSDAAFRAQQAALDRAIADDRQDVIRLARAIEFLPMRESIAGMEAEKARLVAELNRKLAA